MRPNRSHPHRATTPAIGRRAGNAGRPTARNRLRAELVSDGVIAGYIRDISVRRRGEERSVAGRRLAGETE